jgi:DNA gyrase inhibitor GyrI
MSEKCNKCGREIKEDEFRMNRKETTFLPVTVMYVEAKGGLSGVGKAWSELESNLPSLKGRKMYGAYYDQDQDKVYRACVVIINDEEPKELGLPTWTIPGGKFARDKIENFASRVEIIGETFESMERECKRDPKRWYIEFYRSQNEVILLLPIL